MPEPTTCRFILDDGETCRHGLYIDEHKLVDGRWIHPDGLDEQGRWTYDGADDTSDLEAARHDHDTDLAMSGDVDYERNEPA